MGPSGKAWTYEEDQLLRQEVLAGAPVQAIATKLGRTPSAIKTRSYMLRLMLGRPGTKWGPTAISIRGKPTSFELRAKGK